jgi:hypothetical protein
MISWIIASADCHWLKKTVNTGMLIRQYAEASTFNEGYAAVRKGNLWQYIDSTGKAITESIYQDALSFHDGLAGVRVKEGWGYIDYKGQYVIPVQFESARSFYEGLAAVGNTKGNWGYIDTKGNIVISYQYSYADNFENGEAKVMKGEKMLTIDKTNKLVKVF